MKSKAILNLMAAVLLIWAGAAHGDDVTARMARELVRKHGNAVVTVSAVTKTKMSVLGQSQDQEQKVETVGTVIDPSGLTVIAYSSIDSSAVMAAMMKPMQNDQMKMDFKTEVSGVKLRLADGTEVPAKLKLKDPDLDLAFVVPDDASEEGKKLAGKYASISLDGGAATVEQAENVITLGRLGAAMDRQVSVSMERVVAVVSKPRLLFVVSMTEAGAPAFTADGKLLGITAMRIDTAALTSGGITASMKMLQSMFVVLPAKDVAEVAKQVAK